jgi:hypothetical protein
MKKHKVLWILVTIPLVLIQFAPVFIVTSWLYMVGTLAAAERQGIYATAEDGMRARVMKSWMDVDKVEIQYAGPNAFDGSNPHVWFVTAKVWAARRGNWKPLSPKGYDLAGSFFVRVQDGWVHVSEGCFPELLGLYVQIFDYWG